MITCERLLDSALERRVWSYVFVACGLSIVGCMIWSMVLVAFGWREIVFDGVAVIGFGASVAVLLCAEYIVLAPGYFAARQPWRRLLVTRCVAVGVGATVGGVLGACAGTTTTATQGHELGVILGGAIAGILRELRRFSRASRASRLTLKQVQTIISSHGQIATLWCVPVTALVLALSGAERSNAVIIYVACLHSWLAVDWTTTLAGLGLESILLEPLNFRVATRAAQPSFERSVQLLLAALELGDVSLGLDQEVALRAVYTQADDRRAAEAMRKFIDEQRTASSSSYGYGDTSQLRASFGSFYATGGEHDPFLDGSATDGSTPQWRREIDAQRSVLIRAAASSTYKKSWFAPPPLLALASGGLVLGDGKRSLATRLAKLLALEALACGIGDAGLVVQGAAGDVVLARVIRSCLLVLDGLTLRADLCAGGSAFLNCKQAILLSAGLNENDPNDVVAARAAFFAGRFAASSHKKNNSSLAATYTRTYFDDSSFHASPWSAASPPRLVTRLLDGSFTLADLRTFIKQIGSVLFADFIMLWTGKIPKLLPPPEEGRDRVLDQDLSPLEMRATDAAIRALLQIFFSPCAISKKCDPRPRDRLPLVLSSLVALKRALAIDPLTTLDATNTPTFSEASLSPRIYINQRLDFALDSLLSKYATLIPSFAFFTTDAPLIQRRIQRLLPESEQYHRPYHNKGVVFG